jgi:hypothetical protein
MLACRVWLDTDALVRLGFHLVWSDGRRWAVRGAVWHVLDECACGPDICPPHPIITILERAA